MPRTSAERFDQAFEQAARIRDASAPELRDAEVAWAWGVLEARRAAGRTEPCPAHVVRRLEGLLASRPQSVVGRLMALVFDSGSSAAPAMRGTAVAPRTMRFASDDATIDIQVRVGQRKGHVLHVAVTPAQPGLEFVVQPLPRGADRRAQLDADGVGRVSLPSRATSVRAHVRVVGREAFRIPELPLG